METIRVEARRRENAPSLEADLQRARFIAKLLDAQFEIAGVRFGLDALIGLVPIVGDAVATLIGAYPILLARKHGLGKSLQIRMWTNLAVDCVTGLVPGIGDAFDVIYKANLKNLALLERAAEQRKVR